MADETRGERIVLLDDLRAADLGLDHSLGLLHHQGSVLSNVLPHVKAKLLAEGKAALEADYQKQQQQKRPGPSEFKPKRPAQTKAAKKVAKRAAKSRK